MNLPIFAFKEEILQTVREHQVVVLVGSTGSGKTTQAPLYLLEDEYSRIGVLEPRRIAAVSAAEYVNAAFGGVLGQEIGYQIRFDDNSNPGTMVKFMTDGVLVSQARHDPSFSKFDVLIVDEAHERSLNTDFCLGLIHRALELRPELRVIVMSATIDAGAFSEFFGGAPVITVEGRTYPVEVHYLPEDHQYDQLERLALEAVRDIVSYREPGDVLVFLPGRGEINRTASLIESALPQVEVLSVFGEMTMEDQSRIFAPSAGTRVVLATNIAENSLTIPGIVHVVDTGVIRQADYHAHNGIGQLDLVEHSQAGLEQRRGRAGRVMPGHCWRLFTEEQYEVSRRQYSSFSTRMRPKFTKPEILRSDLSGVVLKMLALGISDPRSFPFLDSPSQGSIDSALSTLEFLGAAKNGEITELGMTLSNIPVEPRIGRMLIAASEYGCLWEAVTIAAGMSVRDLFFIPREMYERREADSKKRELSDPRSDFLTILNVVNEYVRNAYSYAWARQNYLNIRALDELFKVREQLVRSLERAGFQISEFGYEKPRSWPNDIQKEQESTITKALLWGFSQNLLIKTTRFGYKPYNRYADVNIHNGSALFRELPEIILAGKIVQNTSDRGIRTYARLCASIEISWILEEIEHLVRKEKTTGYDGRQYNAVYLGTHRIGMEEIVIDESLPILPEPKEVSVQVPDVKSVSVPETAARPEMTTPAVVVPESFEDIISKDVEGVEDSAISAAWRKALEKYNS